MIAGVTRGSSRSQVNALNPLRVPRQRLGGDGRRFGMLMTQVELCLERMKRLFQESLGLAQLPRAPKRRGRIRLTIGLLGIGQARVLLTNLYGPATKGFRQPKPALIFVTPSDAVGKIHVALNVQLGFRWRRFGVGQDLLWFVYRLVISLISLTRAVSAGMTRTASPDRPSTCAGVVRIKAPSRRWSKGSPSWSGSTGESRLTGSLVVSPSGSLSLPSSPGLASTGIQQCQPFVAPQQVRRAPPIGAVGQGAGALDLRPFEPNEIRRRYARAMESDPFGALRLR